MECRKKLNKVTQPLTVCPDFDSITCSQQVRTQKRHSDQRIFFWGGESIVQSRQLVKEELEIRLFWRNIREVKFTLADESLLRDAMEIFASQTMYKYY